VIIDLDFKTVFSLTRVFGKVYKGLLDWLIDGAPKRRPGPVIFSKDGPGAGEPGILFDFTGFYVIVDLIMNL